MQCNNQTLSTSTLPLNAPQNRANSSQPYNQTHNPPHPHSPSSIHIHISTIPPLLRARHIKALKHQSTLFKLSKRIGQATRNVLGGIGDAELEAAVVCAGVGGGTGGGVGGHGVDVAIAADVEDGGV
jgi:hypothetical protein